MSLLRDFCCFLASNLVVRKRQKLRKLGERSGTTAAPAAPTVEEPWRAASPPPAGEGHEEERTEATAPSPARANTPPARQEGTAEEAATEAAKTTEEPVETEAEAATAQPPPPKADPAAAAASDPEATAGAASAGEADPAPGRQEEVVPPEPMDTGAGDKDPSSPQKTHGAGDGGSQLSPQAPPEAAPSPKQRASG